MKTFFGMKISGRPAWARSVIALVLGAASASAFAQISPGLPPPIRDGSVVFPASGTAPPPPQGGFDNGAPLESQPLYSAPPQQQGNPPQQQQGQTPLRGTFQ